MRGSGKGLCAVLLFALCGCMPVEAAFGTGGERSIGRPHSGMLVGGRSLDREGEGYRFYRSWDRRTGLPELAGMMERVAERLEDEAPGPELRIGDMSKSGGGYISGHRSHRSGRDVDLAFYALDPAGRVVTGTSSIPFDRFGVALRDDEVLRFDARRNWLVVEAMLQDPEAEIQWIFVSNGLKAILLEWAMNNDRDMETIKKAASVLHQPGDSAPHDDHFHVRIYCPKQQDNQPNTCTNGRPKWSWIEQTTNPTPGFTDQQLLELALEGL